MGPSQAAVAAGTETLAGRPEANGRAKPRHRHVPGVRRQTTNDRVESGELPPGDRRTERSVRPGVEQADHPELGGIPQGLAPRGMGV